MRFELKTLIFDIICAILFIGIGLFYFNIINVILPVKIISFGLFVIFMFYFGIYRNHNYTENAFKNQGRLDIDKGKVISNLDVLEQTIDKNTKGVEE